MQSFSNFEDSIGSIVIEIFSLRQKLTTLNNRTNDCAPSIKWLEGEERGEKISQNNPWTYVKLL